jgi:iron complex transport system substrate-binding protein
MKKICFTLVTIGLVIALSACGSQSFSGIYKGEDFATLERTGEWDLNYAKMYSVEEYGDYSLVKTNDGSAFLVVPEDMEVPTDLPEGTVVLKQPLNNVYLSSSSVMDMVCAIDATDNIRFTGTKEKDWHIEEAVKAMEEGRLLYGGKYSQPDYELILKDGCSLAIENTMIWHNPETKEKLEEVGIPVLVELSSYEEHPMGRLEWIRLYGLLFDRKEEADEFYAEQIKAFDEITEGESTGKTVAFFYVNANGAVNVKKSMDYVPKMIRMAGGEYIPSDAGDEEENALSTINMQMEEFYADARDADILIYNTTVVADINSVDEILEKSELFADFKAVKNGKVYVAGTDFFQKTTGVCNMIKDLSAVLHEEDESNLTFLRHIY